MTLNAIEKKEFARVMTELEAKRVLLEFDNFFPSIVNIIAKEPIKGSWWGHAKGKIIYNVANEVEDHSDVLKLKLVAGKSTYVHRLLWDALFSILTQPISRQVNSLSPGAKKLLSHLQKKACLRADEIDQANVTAFIKELDLALLIRTESIHTDSGKHIKQMETWSHFLTRRGICFSATPVALAKEKIESAVASVTGNCDKPYLLPWQLKKNSLHRSTIFSTQSE